jgi:two-component system chemotaxis response regulator CheB
VRALPADAPPILVVQRLPPELTAAFAAWLGEGAQVRVIAAEDGAALRPGVVAVASSSLDVGVRNAAGAWAVAVRPLDLAAARPPFDRLADSVAREAGAAGVVIRLGAAHDDAALLPRTG